jgi:LmbE family N-acetylglucosaminyl deacetylase
VTTKRLLLVHAHPDDESSQSAATMARYVSEGAQVTLVTCTLGEYGDVVHPELEHVKGAENLGSHRLAELTEAMAALGVTDFVRLGGDGTYHDSGMVEPEPFRILPEPDRAANAFWDADLLEASLHLVAILRDRRPHVLISYTPFGGYGHPDHIQAHRVRPTPPCWRAWSTAPISDPPGTYRGCSGHLVRREQAPDRHGQGGRHRRRLEIRPTARVLPPMLSAVATSAPTFRAGPWRASRPRPCERTSPRSISPVRCGR